MSEIQRRTLLTSGAAVAGLGAISAVARAGGGGPLNPPADGVSSTGRTLQEVYDKAAEAAAHGPGVGLTAIGGNGVTPLVINAPGSYILTRHVSVVGPSALTINASDVTVDLNGYAIWSDGASAPTVNLAAGLSRVRLRNGVVRGGVYGVFFVNASGCIAEDLQIDGCGSYGVHMNGAGNVVRRCVVQNIGSVGSTSSAIGINCGAGQSIVEDCRVMNVRNNGLTPVVGINVSDQGAAGTYIMRNCVIQTTVVNGTGVRAAGMIRGNTVSGFTTNYNFTPLAVNGGENV